MRIAGTFNGKGCSNGKKQPGKGCKGYWAAAALGGSVSGFIVAHIKEPRTLGTWLSQQIGELALCCCSDDSTARAVAQWLVLLSTPLDLYRLHIAFFVLEGMFVKRAFYYTARLDEQIEVLSRDIIPPAISIDNAERFSGAYPFLLCFAWHHLYPFSSKHSMIILICQEI